MDDHSSYGTRFKRGSSWLRVLTYHQVAEPSDVRGSADPRSISATPSSFSRQMRYLARHYTVVSIEAVLSAITERRPLPRRAVLLTFDDAYSDFPIHVWPVLQALRLPSVVFVPTAYPGHPELAFWWDRIYQAIINTTKLATPMTPIGVFQLATAEARRRAIRALQEFASSRPHDETLAFTDELCIAMGAQPSRYFRVMDWEQLRFLAHRGVAIAGHTQTHATLDRLAPEQVRAEIAGAQSDIAREIGRVLPVFCYPRGGHAPAVVDILRQEGFLAAFTTDSGQNDMATADPLLLKRQNVSPRTTPLVLALRVTRLGGELDQMRLA